MPASSPYRVLARKYRPSSFDDLIGQEAMVRTLTNAFKLKRIHQAYILTGVRGVGKTTTARILARAFNYEVPGRYDAPSIDMPVMGVHCAAILESRHVDVIEMDAASHTGIDDVREVIENARYRPVSARTKVYIIDEVHMLSKQAFNGLLKTLEEPPDHVKFIFATTEIDKVLVTVRSRCQRFDLRRVDLPVLAQHLAKICALEEVDHDGESLTLIAKAADGSVRDSLSILDQAIAHSADTAANDQDITSGRVTLSASAVRAMLGLATQNQGIALFDALAAGNIADALTLFVQCWQEGVDALQLLNDLADYTHHLTRLKVAPDARHLQQDVTLDAAVRAHAEETAQKLSLRALSRFWQILFKGLAEVKEAGRPQVAAEMVLVRLAYASDLPTPDEFLRQMGPDGAKPVLPSPAAIDTHGTASSTAHGAHAPLQTPSLSAKLQNQETALAMRASKTMQSPRAELRVISEEARHTAPLPAPPVPRASEALKPQAVPVQTATLTCFADVLALAKARRDVTLKLALERDVALIAFEPLHIALCLKNPQATDVPQRLAKALLAYTGERWMVSVAPAPDNAQSLHEQALAQHKALRHAVEGHAFVRQFCALFPGSEILSITEHAATEAPRLDDESAADEFFAPSAVLDANEEAP